MSQTTDSKSGMPTRTLGRTGVAVSLIGLGGWHLGFNYIDEQLSIRIMLGEEPPEVKRVMQTA